MGSGFARRFSGGWLVVAVVVVVLSAAGVGPGRAWSAPLTGQPWTAYVDVYKP